MASPSEAYFRIPPITRAWLTGAVLVSLGDRFGLVNPRIFLGFEPATVAYKFQFWRIPLNFTYFGRLSFNWIIQLFMLHNYGSALELNPYPSGGGSHMGNIADFALMLSFGGALLLAIGAYMGMAFMGQALAFMVIYVWSKRHPATEVSLYMFRFQGVYLPWALLAWSLATGDESDVFELQLLGILVGHVFYFLVDVLPNSPGMGWASGKWLHTPSFLYRLFDVPPTYAPPAILNMGNLNRGGGAQPAARHNWGGGGGQVLGR